MASYSSYLDILGGFPNLADRIQTLVEMEERRRKYQECARLAAAWADRYWKLTREDDEIFKRSANWRTLHNEYNFAPCRCNDWFVWDVKPATSVSNRHLQIHAIRTLLTARPHGWMVYIPRDPSYAKDRWVYCLPNGTLKYYVYRNGVASVEVLPFPTPGRITAELPEEQLVWDLCMHVLSRVQTLKPHAS